MSQETHDLDVLSWLERRKKKKQRYKEESDQHDVKCNPFTETSLKDGTKSNEYENRYQIENVLKFNGIRHNNKS